MPLMESTSLVFRRIRPMGRKPAARPIAAIISVLAFRGNGGREGPTQQSDRQPSSCANVSDGTLRRGNNADGKFCVQPSGRNCPGGQQRVSGRRGKRGSYSIGGSQEIAERDGAEAAQLVTRPQQLH